MSARVSLRLTSLRLNSEILSRTIGSRLLAGVVTLHFTSSSLTKFSLILELQRRRWKRLPPESCATSWKSLFFFNLIAVARKSGPKHLAEIVQQIDPTQSVPPSEIPLFVSDLLLSGFLFAITVLAAGIILSFLRDAVDHYVGAVNLWPEVDYIGREIGRIVFALFICALIAVYMLPKGLGAKKKANGKNVVGVDYLVGFSQAVAAPLILCFVVALSIHIIAEFYMYGTGRDFAHFRSFVKPAIILVRPLPSVAIGYCVMLYFGLREGKQPVSFPLILCVSALLVSLLSLLVVVTFLRFDFLLALPTLLPEYKGRGIKSRFSCTVLANALVSMAAFSSIVLFFRGEGAARLRP